MPFSSFEFILFFLPLSLGVYILLGKNGLHRASLAWLVGCSLFFYAWWNYIYLWLMCASILFNYCFGIFLSRPGGKRHLALIIGVASNLALLGYFKYANFFIGNANALLGLGFNTKNIILPLGISFFTFTQIAYLVDTYRAETHEYKLLEYTLFVTYFPHLIAGPILHHKEIIPQFKTEFSRRINANHLLIGLVIFSIGLAKKVLIADHISGYANPIFSAADSGVSISFFEAWGAALSYTLQLYFDFSGYADMAIGASMMFGIRLPMNFNSPYKSSSIIEFWQRWHMSLSRFLRDYLYIPLGGNRFGAFNRYRNLMITMLLGGLWHGAAWSFFIWGGLHGMYLIINHTWRYLCDKYALVAKVPQTPYRLFSIAITFLAVVLALVVFRAESLSGAVDIFNGMAGRQSFELPIKYLQSWGHVATVLQQHGINFTDTLFEGVPVIRDILWLLLFVFLLPNVVEIMSSYQVITDRKVETNAPSRLGRLLQFRPSWPWALFSYFLLAFSILELGGVSDFLYFQF